MREQEAHRIRPAFHGSAMQHRLADAAVRTVRIEPRGQHRLERPGIVSLGGLMKRVVVIVGDVARELGMRSEQRNDRIAIASTTRRDEPIDIR